MTVSTGDVVRITSRFTIFDEDLQNVYHVTSVAGAGAADNLHDAAAVTWLDNAYNQLTAQISDEVTRQDIVIQNITEGTPARFSAWDTYPVGADTNTPLPLQCSALVSFPSDIVKSIGRKYIGQFTEADNEGEGVPTAGVLAALAAYATIILLGYTPFGATMVAGNFNYDNEQFAQWVFSQVAAFWATQRRRRAGVGS